MDYTNYSEIEFYNTLASRLTNSVVIESETMENETDRMETESVVIESENDRMVDDNSVGVGVGVGSLLVDSVGVGSLLVDSGEVVGVCSGEVVGDDSGEVVGVCSGEVVGVDSGEVVGDDSGEVVGVDSGEVVGVCSGEVVGDDSGEVVGDDSGEVVGDDSGEVVGDDSGEVVGDDSETRVYHSRYDGIWSSSESSYSSEGYDDINSTYCYVISVDDKPYAYNTNVKRVKYIMNELAINFRQKYRDIYTTNTVECGNGSLHIVGSLNNTLITYDQVLKTISYSRVKWLN